MCSPSLELKQWNSFGSVWHLNNVMSSLTGLNVMFMDRSSTDPLPTDQLETFFRMDFNQRTLLNSGRTAEVRWELWLPVTAFHVYSGGLSPYKVEIVHHRDLLGILQCSEKPSRLRTGCATVLPDKSNYQKAYVAVIRFWSSWAFTYVLTGLTSCSRNGSPLNSLTWGDSLIPYHLP